MPVPKPWGDWTTFFSTSFLTQSVVIHMNPSDPAFTLNCAVMLDRVCICILLEYVSFSFIRCAVSPSELHPCCFRGSVTSVNTRTQMGKELQCESLPCQKTANVPLCFCVCLLLGFYCSRVLLLYCYFSFGNTGPVVQSAFMRHCAVVSWCVEILDVIFIVHPRPSPLCLEIKQAVTCAGCLSVLLLCLQHCRMNESDSFRFDGWFVILLRCSQSNSSTFHVLYRMIGSNKTEYQMNLHL